MTNTREELATWALEWAGLLASTARHPESHPAITNLRACAAALREPLPPEVRELVAAAQAGIKVGYALNPQSPTWPKLAVAIAAVEALMTPKEAKQ